MFLSNIKKSDRCVDEVITGSYAKFATAAAAIYINAFHFDRMFRSVFIAKITQNTLKQDNGEICDFIKRIKLKSCEPEISTEYTGDINRVALP